MKWRRIWLVGLLFGAPALAEGEATSAPGAPTVEVRFAFEVVDPGPLPPAGTLRLFPHTERQAADPSFEQALPFGPAASPVAMVPTGQPWRLDVDAPGFWAFSQILQPQPRAGPLSIRVLLWRTGRITGTVQMPGQAEKPPGELWARMQPAPDKRLDGRTPAGRVRCPVDARGRFSCALPGGTVDLSIAAEGFIPRYFWGFAVMPGQERSLGQLQLQRGASVAGFLIATGKTLDPKATQVRLLPWLADPAGGGVGPRLTAAAPLAEVDARGFFQARGLAPGTYRLVAEHPGLARAEVGPFTLATGEELWLREPVALELPGELVVRVVPPLDPVGRAWQVSAHRQGEREQAAPADPSGLARLAAFRSGPYRLRVTDSAGNRWYSDDGEPVTFEPGEPEREIRLSLVTIEGRARIGDEPLVGTLWFGSKHGSVRVQVETDEDGRFTGALPRGRGWPVHAEPVTREELALEWVDVQPDDHGFAEIDLQWPDTEVFGTVVYPDGEPAPGAQLQLFHPLALRSYEADSAGRFRLQGLRPEPCSLAAAASRGGEELASAPVELDLNASSQIGPVVLTLRRRATLEGRVVAPLGPVAGAKVTVLPASPGVAFSQPAVAGPDGRFEVALPQHGGGFIARVAAAGFPLQSFPLGPGQDEVELRLTTLSGQLRLRSLPTEAARDSAVLLWAGGVATPLSILRRELRSLGGTLPVPAEGEAVLAPLAPGAYQLCRLTTDEWAQQVVRNPPPGLGRCAGGVLAAGQELVLELPPAPPADRAP